MLFMHSGPVIGCLTIGFLHVGSIEETPSEGLTWSYLFVSLWQDVTHSTQRARDQVDNMAIKLEEE